MSKLSQRGITLVEIVVATGIMVSVALGFAEFFPQAVNAVTKWRTHSVATTLASTKIQDVTKHPYAAIPITPGGAYFNANAANGPCDCSAADFSQPISGGSPYTSSETITVGGLAYTRQTCVNYIQHLPLGWQSSCTQDNAMKQIVTHVAWRVGHEDQAFQMTSMVSPSAPNAGLATSTGSVSVTVCAADGNHPPGGCGPASVNGAEVAIYNNAFMAENGHALPPNPVQLSVPPGPGYTLHVQLLGYFPYHETGITIPASGSISKTVILRDLPTYGSKLAGETFTATHPVITKVVAQVADIGDGCTPVAPAYCMDKTEALEIYNPTPTTYAFGAGGNLSVNFCTGGTSPSPNFCINNNFSTPGIFTMPFPTLPPGSYFLIVGQDPAHPPAWIAPDVTYDPTNAALQFPGQTEGLIPYKTGGGIQLLLNGIVIDEVLWTGIDSTQSPPGGPSWTDASPLPAGSIKPVICNHL